MARTRTWKVAVAKSMPVEKVSERLVGTHGLVVVWRVIRTGELVEQRYVRRADRWQRYEDWCKETGRTPVPAQPTFREWAAERVAKGWRNLEAELAGEKPPVRLPTDSVIDEPWISWRGDHSVRWFV